MSKFTSPMQADGISAMVNRLGFVVVRIEDRGTFPGGTEYAGKAIVTLVGKPTYGQVFDAIYRHREEWPDAWSVLPDAYSQCMVAAHHAFCRCGAQPSNGPTLEEVDRLWAERRNLG